MTDDGLPTPTDQTQDQPQAPAVEAPPAAAVPDPAETLAKEAADLKDKLLRTLAEMENLRRRAEREVADAKSYGIANFARDVVVVADSMRRALDAVEVEMRDTADERTKALIEGLDLTERELLKVMEKHGIRRIDPQGEKFDPNFHQAMFELPDPNATPGTVVQVMQSGYKIGERVLRPALVGVAKLPPKPAAEVPASENPQPN